MGSRKKPARGRGKCFSAKRLSDLLRDQISKQQRSQYRIAADTGIKQPSLSRFLNGGSLKMETAAVLLDYLGFEICAKAGSK